MIQGSSPRPGFGIAVPENEIPGWFTHQSKESSIRVQMPSNYLDGDDNGWMGFAACAAFNTYRKSPLFCHFKVDGKEYYPSPMYIGCNSMQALSNHLWLFYLSFDYLKELKEWENESYSDLELSFHSYDQGVKVENCGVRMVNSGHLIVASKEAASSYTPLWKSPTRHLIIARKEAAFSYTPLWQSPTGDLIIASKEAASSYIDSLANSSSYSQWMHDVFFSFRGQHNCNNFTHLHTALGQRGIIRYKRQIECLEKVESRLVRNIKKSGLSIIIFARDYVSTLGFDGFHKIGDFMENIESDTVFPVSTVSCTNKQSKSYTIVLEKYEEDFSEDKEKVQRWMDILTEVAISAGSASSFQLDRNHRKGN